MPEAPTKKQQQQARSASPRGGRWRRSWLLLKRIGGALARYVRRLFDPTLSRTRRLVYAGAGMVGASVLVLGMGLLILAATVPFTPSLSQLRKMKVQHPTRVLTAGGEELGRFQQVNRRWVSLNEVSPHVVAALVATEDHRFYTHHGVDYRRLASSTVYTALGDRQGASTITMQLARNLYPRRIGRAASLMRKLKEIVTAYKIEYAYEKDEILETYLNTVPFLYNATGIERAARTYFGKPARRLDVAESATLVGMLKATSYYNPVRNPDRATQRRNVVLRQMVKQGVLDAADYEALRERPLRVDFKRQGMPGSREAPHFVDHVRRWLTGWADEEGYNLYTEGLKVYTTLDARLQRLAEEAVARQGQALQDVADVEWSRAANPRLSDSPHDYHTPRKKARPFAHFWREKTDLVDAFVQATDRYRRGVAAGTPAAEVRAALRRDRAFMDSLRTATTRLETGFVAIDPRTGQVKAWVGSRSHARDKFDHVAQARRQPGSTFKPFVYAAALEAGYKPTDTLPDRAVEIEVEGGPIWRPVNAGGYSGQEMTLRDALAQSKNTITAQLIHDVGPLRTARLARRMGVNQSTLKPVPSLALGTSSVTLLEMASAYTTIANAGVYRAPVFIARIEDADGTVLYEAPARERRVLSEPSAHALIDMMRGVIDRGTGRRIRQVFGVRADVAGKTGTTQDNADGWFLMMHPHLVAGAWVGFNDPRVTFRSDYWGQGAHNALYVVGDFYRHALRQGRLDPRPALGPVPIYEQRPSFFARAGAWFNETVDRLGQSLRREGEAVAEAAPPARRAPAPRPQPERPAPRVEDGRRELEQAARDVGRLLQEVDRFLSQHDAEVAGVYRERVESYLRDAERFLRDQQRRPQRRRHPRRADRRANQRFERFLEDTVDRYAGSLDAQDRAELERFMADLQREIERAR